MKYTKGAFKKVWELELSALCHTVILLQEITAVTTLDTLQKFLYLSVSGCEMCTSLRGEESPTDARGISSHLARWEMRSLMLKDRALPLDMFNILP